MQEKLGKLYEDFHTQIKAYESEIKEATIDWTRGFFEGGVGEFKSVAWYESG
ncbi:MAG: hypothetical protein ACOC5T_00465 [Elusimicrobiota bacterium]